MGASAAIETVLETNGARLAVRQVGAGHPIVVLHGGPDFDYGYLLPEIDRLAGLGQLLLYAQRGRGRSYAGEGPDDVSIESEMADLDAVRALSGSEAVAIIGHSWGGVLAMEYAVRYPERVSHLVLVGSAPASHADALSLRSHLRSLRTPDQQDRMQELRADGAYLAGDVDAEAELYRIHFARALRDPADVDRVVRRLRRTFTPEAIVAARAIEDGLYAQTWDVASYDLLPRLRTLRLPTLVVRGDHDFVPTAISAHIAEAVPDARLVVIAECGHFVFMEQPDAILAEIAQLLAR